MTSPISDDHDPIRETLRRDAARVPEPPFDPALHNAAIRRIRALAETAPAKPWLVTWPALAATAVVLLALILVALWQPHRTTDGGTQKIASSAPVMLPRASVLAYQAAERQGDDALFAALDRDASVLLPQSSPVFNVALR